ncbi:MAG: di-trans,poly-cis-decaprenylcistransferase [Nitrososphaerota archaeon]|nr:di-trans,poly-cis-decaprenylcistransferase [Nitrososphaerota archaeon]MDG7051340.1 di-trans,poly-cis-decaprenylcistransferase [Nitrososphaerota archaeon]
MAPKFSSIIRGISRVLLIDRLYELVLENEIRGYNVPNHIGIIMDGNRRWAEKKGLPSFMGYLNGSDTAENLLYWCLDYGIKVVTLYALSLENLNREKGQLDIILKSIYDKLLKLESTGLLQRNKIRFMAIGQTSMLPQYLKDEVEKLREMTKDNDKMFLNIAIAYGGRDEIIQAVKGILRDFKEGKVDIDKIDDDSFSKYLFTGDLSEPEPDLIIRTSGEMRLSGFLPWQSSYSELIFIDEYWPELRRIDLLRAIKTYQGRKRRFGR